MPFFLYEIRKSDGNDCIVYDCIIEAESDEAADEEVFDHFDSLSDLESDGDRGFNRDCDCDEPDEPEDNPADCVDCDVVRINGVFCHESGCPTEREYQRLMKLYNNFECQGHGGFDIGEPQGFNTYEDAEAETATFHSRYHI